MGTSWKIDIMYCFQASFSEGSLSNNRLKVCFQNNLSFYVLHSLNLIKSIKYGNYKILQLNHLATNRAHISAYREISTLWHLVLVSEFFQASKISHIILNSP